MKVKIDLGTRAGRRAMRAWLDEMDGRDERPALLQPRVDWWQPAFKGGAPVQAPDPEPPIGGIPDPDPVETPPAEPAPPIPEDFTVRQQGEVPDLLDHGEAPALGEAPASETGVSAAAAAAEAMEAGEGGSPAEAPAPAPREPELSEDMDALPAASAYLDRNRDWTDDDKRRTWSLLKQGHRCGPIARHLGRNQKQVANWIGHVRRGTQKVPAGPSTALVPVAPVERPPYAIDPVIQEERDADLADAQVESFVKRELYSAPPPIPDAVTP